jgi:hypothetical protein
MENTQYYCWDGYENNVLSWDGATAIEVDHWPNQNEGKIEINRAERNPKKDCWIPTTREVFEATRAKVLDLMRKESAI